MPSISQCRRISISIMFATLRCSISAASRTASFTPGAILRLRVAILVLGMRMLYCESIVNVTHFASNSTTFVSSETISPATAGSNYRLKQVSLPPNWRFSRFERVPADRGRSLSGEGPEVETKRCPGSAALVSTLGCDIYQRETDHEYGDRLHDYPDRHSTRHRDVVIQSQVGIVPG